MGSTYTVSRTTSSGLRSSPNFLLKRCLENVLLSLYWHKYLSLEQFISFHSRQNGARLWTILKDIERTLEPEFGDVVLHDGTAHAGLFLSMWDCKSGYTFVEFWRDDRYFSNKHNRWTEAWEEFVSLSTIATALKGFHMHANNCLLVERFNKVECAVVANYLTSSEFDLGYCDVNIGDNNLETGPFIPERANQFWSVWLSLLQQWNKRHPRMGSWTVLACVEALVIESI